MSKCDLYQQQMAEDGPDIVNTNAELKAHRADCEACTDFATHLRRVENDLRSLDDIDAPDALVEKTLRAVEAAAAADAEPKSPILRRRYLAGGLAATVAAAASLVLVLNMPGLWPTPLSLPRDVSESDLQPSRDQVAALENGTTFADGPEPSAPMLAAPPADDRRRSNTALDEPGVGDEKYRESFEIAGLAEESEPTSEIGRTAGEKAKADFDGLSDIAEPELQTHGAFAEAEPPDDAFNEPSLRFRAESRSDDNRQAAGQRLAPQTKTEEPVLLQDPAAVVLEGELAEAAPESDRFVADTGRLLALPAEQDRISQSASGAASPIVADEEDGSRGALRKQLNELAGADALPSSVDEISQAGTPDLLERYASLQDVIVQDATGYWSNSYIPGDPAMRLLAARLDAWDRSDFGAGLRLDQAVEPVVQPFDAPRDAAIAIYLASDTPVIEGPTRMRVQVGLKATDRQGGQRPAMNIGLVLDLRETPMSDASVQIRALIEAMERARQPDDRFSLTVAGPYGGLVLPPDQFRHGPIRVAIEELFSNQGATDVAPIDLGQALTLATESVLAGDDPTAVLGSSLVLLVTPSSLADDLSDIAPFAHRNAIGGIPMSVISVGQAETMDHIDRIVAAGQGNRRILDTAQAAEGVVDRELHAASRAVARALRLRIRLAPGVELIDVLGSERLAEPAADRVREAEQSIDQRLARNLGIDADRGEDEDGIQIVIPNFYAGDSHVVLLDVVAQGPGPIADVRVRYKDVAHLRNGVAEAALSIDDQHRLAGPLEHNVLKNLVAFELSRRVGEAGRVLAAGDIGWARSLIAAMRQDISDLRTRVAGWPTDANLNADETVLAEYLTALSSPVVADPIRRRDLADSLAYTAFLKTQPAFR